MTRRERRSGAQLRGGTASSADVAALGRIQDYARDELPRTYAQADKWIGGVTALTTLLTVAIVVKGPETFTDLVAERTMLGITFAPQNAIIGLMLVGGALIGFGIFKAYSAAHGDPLTDSALQSIAYDPESLPLEGLDGKWREAVNNVAVDARSDLRLAVSSSIAGVAALALAVLMTWTTETASGPDNGACARLLPEGQIVELADVPAPVDGELSVVVITCPE